MGVAGISDLAKNEKYKGKDHDFNISKSSMSSLFFSRSSPSSTLSSSSQTSQVQSAVANNSLDGIILPISILKGTPMKI